MTLALALLPLMALLAVMAGPAVLPGLGALTALAVVLLRHAPMGGWSLSAWFAASVALVISTVPAWKLGGYTQEAGPSRTGMALGLALALIVAGGASLPSAEALLPGEMALHPALASAPAVTVGLIVTFAGLAALAVRPGILHQFAGLVTTCDGVLLSAANLRQPRALWAVACGVLLLSLAALSLARRLSLHRVHESDLEQYDRGQRDSRQHDSLGSV